MVDSRGGEGGKEALAQVTASPVAGLTLDVAIGAPPSFKGPKSRAWGMGPSLIHHQPGNGRLVPLGQRKKCK